ncbi:MAG: UDP-N-acetylglucosamine 1-carboxyvinyltransferase [Candidatus Gracilibacteria bacterium]|nr:UDP-N-acetylglucosamine 1-carboxyvinyltransferase [Candidatus Gracilibacteria bacterium]
MQKFIIQGGHPLKGDLLVSGSKNAALPILAACLLASEPVVLENVPRIGDVEKMLLLLARLGVKTEWEGDLLKLDAREAQNTELFNTEAIQLRGSIVLMGALLARFGKVQMDFPGGCVLGKRPIESHLDAFAKLGARVLEHSCNLHLEVDELKGADFCLFEPSVTATENALLAAVLAKGKTTLRLVATEPHVQDLCHFLNKLGAKITGIGTPYLEIEGVAKLGGGTYKITGDYLEAGTFAIAVAAVPGSVVTLKGIETKQLDSLWNKLRLIGVDFELTADTVSVHGASKLKAVAKLDSRLYPYFPTDLQAPFSVLLTQAEGVSKIFETLFEGRLNYLFELEKMGAKIEILNPHQAIVIGKTPLKGTAVASCDIRAGAAIVVAALLAAGSTEISNINYIDRGYERLDEKLLALGAKIERK